MSLYLIPFMLQIIVSGFYYKLAEKHRRNTTLIALLGFGIGTVTYSLLAAITFFTDVPRFLHLKLGIPGVPFMLFVHLLTFGVVYFVYKRLEKHYKNNPREIENPDVLD